MVQHEEGSEEVQEGVRQVRLLAEQDPAVAEALRQVEEQEGGEEALLEAVEQTLQRDAVEELLSDLRTEAQKRVRRRNWIIGGFLTYVGLMALLAIFTHNFHMVSNIGSMTGLIAAAGAATKGQKKIAQTLAQYKDDVRVAGPLAEALEFQDKKLYPIAAEVLIHLLPQLKASDRDRLNGEQRACLYRALRGKNTALTLAILKSLQQIGDGKALPYVQKLEADPRAMGRDARIREEVAACLPFLADLAEREKNSQTLLRAADGNATQSDVLLRAAQSSPSQTEPDQLLRAAVPSDYNA